MGYRSLFMVRYHLDSCAISRHSRVYGSAGLRTSIGREILALRARNFGIAPGGTPSPSSPEGRMHASCFIATYEIMLAEIPEPSEGACSCMALISRWSVSTTSIAPLTGRKLLRRVWEYP